MTAGSTRTTSFSVGGRTYYTKVTVNSVGTQVGSTSTYNDKVGNQAWGSAAGTYTLGGVTNDLILNEKSSGPSYDNITEEGDGRFPTSLATSSQNSAGGKVAVKFTPVSGVTINYGGNFDSATSAWSGGQGAGISAFSVCG